MQNEALELVVRGEQDAVAFACATCGAVFPLLVDEAKSRAAGHCCNTCRCGGNLAPGMSLCSTCTDDERKDREGRLFEKATKVRVDDYPDEPVYWEGKDGSMGAGFFTNLDELLDFCEEERVAHPKYVWACEPRPLQVPTEAVLQAACDEHNVAGFDDLSIAAIDELQATIDAWCLKQNVRTWFPDFSRAVLLAASREDR
jgi:hypothetical protein